MILMAAGMGRILLIVGITLVVVVIATTVRYRLTGRALPRALSGGAPEPAEKETESWKR